MQLEMMRGAEPGLCSRPRVHILIGADNDTLLVNGDKIRLAVDRRKDPDVLPRRKNIDAVSLLQYLQGNQKRWISPEDQAQVLERRIREIEPDLIESHTRSYLSTRLNEARKLLLHRVRVGGVPLVSTRVGLEGRMDIGIMNFDLSMGRVLIDLKGYPYAFNQPRVR